MLNSGTATSGTPCARAPSVEPSPHVTADRRRVRKHRVRCGSSCSPWQVRGTGPRWPGSHPLPIVTSTRAGSDASATRAARVSAGNYGRYASAVTEPNVTCTSGSSDPGHQSDRGATALAGDVRGAARSGLARPRLDELRHLRPVRRCRVGAHPPLRRLQDRAPEPHRRRRQPARAHAARRPAARPAPVPAGVAGPAVISRSLLAAPEQLPDPLPQNREEQREALDRRRGGRRAGRRRRGRRGGADCAPRRPPLLRRRTPSVATAPDAARRRGGARCGAPTTSRRGRWLPLVAKGEWLCDSDRLSGLAGHADLRGGPLPDRSRSARRTRVRSPACGSAS